MESTHKAEREKRIFTQFACVSGLPISEPSIESKEPPEPDIACALVDGSLLTFELIEILDATFPKGASDRVQLDKRLHDEWLRRGADSLLLDREIAVAFGDISFAKKCAAVPKICDLLERAPSDLEGRLSTDDLRPAVKWIHVFRLPGHRGPTMATQDGGWFGNPQQKQVAGKFAKSYSGQWPKHLLAY